MTSFLPTCPVIYSYKNYGSDPSWANASQMNRTVGEYLNNIALFTTIYITFGAWNSSSLIWTRLIIQKSNASKAPRLCIHDWWLRVDHSSSDGEFKEKSWYAVSGWGLPKEKSVSQMERIVSLFFAQNRLLCHWCTSKLCPCAFYSNDRFDRKKKKKKEKKKKRKKRKKRKKKYLGHFDYSTTPFLGSVESVLNVLNGGRGGK